MPMFPPNNEEDRKKLQQIQDAIEKYKNPILNEREKTHGSFEEVAEKAQDLKNIISLTVIQLRPIQREALDMISSKLARICCGNPNEVDHWKDIAGYAELVVASLEQNEKKTKQGE